MCGIAGYCFFDGSYVNNTEVVNGMLAAQRHRGPDDSGIVGFSFQSGECVEFDPQRLESVESRLQGFLGFNRLSIRDLTKNGHQPMFSDDRTLVLLFNGEIYNATELTSTLQVDGFQFRSTTDTEVILNLIIRDGFVNAVEKLNGMFAIVLLNLRDGTISFARDRFGVKPMYLYRNNGALAFSSELKSFYSFPGFRASLNREAVDEYLVFRGLVGGKSLLRNVREVLPGSIEVFDASGQGKKMFFFDVDNYGPREENHKVNAVIDTLSDMLTSSVKRQLVSDVKVGCQLSGGVDSSLVTYYASALQPPGSLETISITLEDERYSEERFMNHVRGHLDLKAHLYRLEADYYFDKLLDSTWHLEMPINHPNTIGIFYLSQMAKRHVTVLLSGEGADEVFGGYSRFASVSSPYSWRTLKGEMGRTGGSWPSVWRWCFDAQFRAVSSSAFLTESCARRAKPDLNFEDSIAERIDCYSKLSGNAFEKQIKYEVKNYLPDLLIRQDKMSMAHSIENRVPFLDNHLVDYAFSIPQECLLPSSVSHQRRTKFPLKQLASHAFGDSFAFRSKRGFGIPLREFFLRPGFNEFLREVLLPKVRRNGIFDERVVERLITTLHLINREDLNLLWEILAFEVWIDRFKVEL